MKPTINNMNIMKKIIILLSESMLTCVLYLLPFNSMAQAGTLDITFDTDGIVTTPFGNSAAFGRSIAIQSDGKIVVAGYSANVGVGYFYVARYNVNGSLDTSFDVDGKVSTDFGATYSEAHSVAIQNDGKIVVAGGSYIGTQEGFALVRYNTNGSLDTSFNGDGKLTTFLGITFDQANCVIIQSDGKILAAGFSQNGFQTDMALARYDTNGNLDSTFDTDGKVTTAIGIDDDEAKSIAIQSDGKILVAGVADSNIAVARYNIDGSLDTTFDIDGVLTTSVTSSFDTYTSIANSIAVQSDGKIVVAGSSSYLPWPGTEFDYFTVVRYETNGNLDNSFDSDGIVITTVLHFDSEVAKSVIIQSDSKILVAGEINDLISNFFALLRYNLNGTLDNTFGIDGKVLTTSIGAGSGNSIDIQSDGKIVAVGSTYYPSPSIDFALVRYNNDIINGINENIIQNEILEIFPNPYSCLTTLKTNNLLKNSTLTVYNIFGQEVKQLTNLSGKIIIIDREKLASGLYFIRLKENNRIISRNKLIITD